MKEVFGVGGKLLKAVQRLFVDRACVRVRANVSDWFLVSVRLTKGCVMSRLFNIYL